MQHQHQQFASLHSNQASLLFPVTNPPTYYQPQTMPMTSTQSGATHPSSSFGVRLSASSNPPGQSAVDLGSNTSQSASLGSSSVGQGSSNQVPGQFVATIFFVLDQECLTLNCVEFLKSLSPINLQIIFMKNNFNYLR